MMNERESMDSSGQVILSLFQSAICANPTSDNQSSQQSAAVNQATPESLSLLRLKGASELGI